MLDHEPTGGPEPSGSNPNDDHTETGGVEPAQPATRRRTTRKSTTRKEQPAGDPALDQPAAAAAGAPAGQEQPAGESARQERSDPGQAAAAGAARGGGANQPAQPWQPGSAVLFMAPATQPVRDPAARDTPARDTPARDTDPEPADAGAESTDGRRRRRSRRESAETTADATTGQATAPVDEPAATDEPVGDQPVQEDQGDQAAGRSRRRGRRGRGRGKGSHEPAAESTDQPEPAVATETDDAPDGTDTDEDTDEAAAGTVTRRRRRRRRKGSGGEPETPSEDGVTTVVKVREPRSIEDEVRGVSGSTRLEAKRQRRRGGRDQRRTRPPVLSESEFLARREAVDRVMVIRQNGPDRATQIGVLEDGILVEHYVSRVNSSAMAGSVYLGKVQNVLPSMEAAFVDVGRGRNAVLYAGEVNWDASGLEGRSRSIEQALSPGDSVLVQVTKDPVGHKGARLTSNIALSGRHLVYTPYGNASGISRKLPENERRRLRDVLKQLVPEGAGVIVRTAAESASADELARDVKRLQAQWDDIQAKAAQGNPPALLYSEPDLVVRVVRDLFNEDFRELVVEGEEAYQTVEAYLSHVSPDLVARLRRHTGSTDAFSAYRIDEQILKGLDRKVFLPSGGHLVFDRTEAMTVIDVNTGKYTGTGGNLEETVTRNNLEAAEEIVRQLRLRDIGGIIVIDFIDMVLESNRDLVLRRLTECLGRDRTKHQVTEITSLGLVQMTRKRVGAGLLEAFSEPCDCCKGRGVVVQTEPAGDQRPRGNQAEKVKAVASASGSGSGRRRGRRNGNGNGNGTAADTDTMGYDLSRYEDPATPAPEVAASEPVEPLTEPDTGSAAGPAGEQAAENGARRTRGTGAAGRSVAAGSVSAGSVAAGSVGAGSFGAVARSVGVGGSAGIPDSASVGEISLSGVLRRFRRRGGGRR